MTTGRSKSIETILREAEHGEVLAFRALEQSTDGAREQAGKLLQALCADEVDYAKVQTLAKSIYRASCEMQGHQYHLTCAQDWHDRARERHEAETRPQQAALGGMGEAS